MIAYLSGKLLSKQPNSVIIDVNGVGYELNIPLSTFYELGDAGAQVELRVHTHVREDALLLFGFRTGREKDLFLRLTSVSGIGPKLALTALSGMPADELIQAIRTNDLARLTAIPGVGRKTAERLIIELRDKMAAFSSTEVESRTGIAAPAATEEDSLKEDIISALVNLGWQKNIAERAVIATIKEETGNRTFEYLLKQSLKRLYR
ncbi:MAG TPA: Holliday junction branch migration protein RuvA [Blastocatellia bacterium]|nr:Holliday junction branch migration protein RuvA [Blastocatellia bacterium]